MDLSNRQKKYDIWGGQGEDKSGGLCIYISKIGDGFLRHNTYIAECIQYIVTAVDDNPLHFHYIL